MITDEWLEKQWNKIEVMLDKCERDPSWINNTILECMIQDYEAKQKLAEVDEHHRNRLDATRSWDVPIN